MHHGLGFSHGFHNNGLKPTKNLSLGKHPQGLGLGKEDKAALVASLKALSSPSP